MILRITTFIVATLILSKVQAEVAPEITTLAEGYNVVAKLPCIGCPFLYQDSTSGQDEGWKVREDENALLLNISLPLDSAYLSINTANLLTPSAILPHIYATQILLDTSPTTLSALIDTGSLENPGSAYFGLSYTYSLRRLKDSQARVFTFDVLEAWTDLASPPKTVTLDNDKQKVLEIVLLDRPIMSPGDMNPTYEIVRAQLVPRASTPLVRARTMRFHEWDVHGQKGTPAHLVAKTSDASLAWITSGVWSLLLFIMAVIALFVVLCLFLVFGCGCFGGDEYEQAQSGKKRGGAMNDVERGKGRFLSADELGIRGVGGRVVGVGKRE
ncbi:hypothetical protein DE146DRAFT_671398 [Phaeosphaeria sp. MPI-PUGE-AT-0046c]|nr:hypothetical protein DE146DRAFT_671398 [Phaeosphaeria sp. MPI-PUGE-AT-0046c]